MEPKYMSDNKYSPSTYKDHKQHKNQMKPNLEVRMT